MYKRFLAVIMLASLLAGFAACGTYTLELPPTEVPTAPATEAFTEEIPEASAETEPETEPQQEELSNRYADFCGRWNSTTQFHEMNISIENDIMYVEYFCYSANATRIATTIVSQPLSDIENDQITFYYSDDGWGNEGTILLDFSHPDQIASTTVTTHTDTTAQWSIIAGSRIFTR